MNELIDLNTCVFIQRVNKAWLYGAIPVLPEKDLIDLNTCVFIQRVNKAWLYGAIPVLPEKGLKNLVLEHALVYVTLKH